MYSSMKHWHINDLSGELFSSGKLKQSTDSPFQVWPQEADICEAVFFKIIKLWELLDSVFIYT